MAYDDIFQPGIYKSWTEAIIKEKKIRMKWHEEYGPKIKESSLEKQIQDSTPEDPCTCKDGTRYMDEMYWPRKGATGTSTIIRVLNTPSDMVPPTPLVKSILYEGISRDGKGRVGYLRKRWETDPERRYRSHVCTNWIYGWNHGKENELSCTCPETCNIRKIAFEQY